MATTSEYDSDNKVQKLRRLLTSEGSAAWELAWQDDCTPWDAGKAQPPLMEILSNSFLHLPPNGRALIPGCGRGYDTLAIASYLKYNAVGLDVANSAVKVATEMVKRSGLPAADKVKFIATDFFTYSVPDCERFDLIYDYTFFCAIPPALRVVWGDQMKKLIKPGGYLIALVYPIDGPREGGPPFSVSVGLYEEALGQCWDRVIDKTPDESDLTHVGRERLVVWRMTDGILEEPWFLVAEDGDGKL